MWYARPLGGMLDREQVKAGGRIEGLGNGEEAACPLDALNVHTSLVSGW